MSLFKEQIDLRREQERRALWKAYANLAMGVNGENLHMAHSEGRADEVYLHLLRLLGDTETTLGDNSENWQREFETALRRNQVMYRKVKLLDGWWRETCGVLLGRLKDGRLIILQPRRWGGYGYHDPKTGKRRHMSRKEAERISEDAYCFYPPLPPGKIRSWQIARFMLSLFDYSDWVFIFLAFLVVTLLGMFTPFVTKTIFDSIIPSGDTRDLMPVAALLVGAGVGGAIFTVCRNLLLERVKDKLVVYVEAAVMGRVFNMPLQFFRNYSPGDLSNRIMGFSKLCTLLGDQSVSSILVAIYSLVYVGQMFHYASDLAIPGLSVIAFSFVLICLNFFLGINYRNRLEEVHSKLLGLTYSIFSSIQKIKLSGSEVRIFNKWSEVFRQNTHLASHPPVYFRMNTALSALCTTGGFVWLYYCAYQSNVSVSDYMAFNSAYGMVSSSLGILFSLIPILQQVQPVYRLVQPILHAETESDAESTQISSLSGDIDMVNLSFRYSPDAPFVINNLNLHVHPGEYVGIVGASGCGKSTLFRLLLGFEKPEQGGIYYDQYDLNLIDKPSLRRHIGTCLQTGKLFAGDIFSNITITAPWATQDDAWEAARMAACDEDIKKMPMGMRTIISEGGSNLSGGQRQRILIARALINKPSILLMDEATNALDNVRQKTVTHNLDTLGCTRIVIAHRLTTIRGCDRIVVLDGGSIAEEGTFEELVAKRGLFYELSKQQL